MKVLRNGSSCSFAANVGRGERKASGYGSESTTSKKSRDNKPKKCEDTATELWTTRKARKRHCT